MELHSWTVYEIEVLVDVYVRRRRVDKASRLKEELTRRLTLEGCDGVKLSALLQKLEQPKVVGFTQRITAPVVYLFNKTGRKTA